MALVDHFNSKSGEAWPSNATLAAELEMDRRTIQRAKVLLVARNHLTVVGSRRGGRKHTTHYRLHLNNEKAKTLNDKPKELKGRQPCHPFDNAHENAKDFPERAASSSHKGRRGRRPNPKSDSVVSTDFEKMDAKGWFEFMPVPAPRGCTPTRYSNR